MDERLVHGQVTLGWGSQLRPSRYWVVDDELAGTEWEKELYRLGTPADAEAAFVTVAEARRSIPEWQASPERSMVLTRDIEHMLEMARGGLLAGESVNLGGLHYRTGRTEVLPYLFLDEEDRRRLREIESEGAAVWAQDLPGSPDLRGPDLLDG